MLKVQEIREIIKLIDQSSITEFKYKVDESTITLKKTPAGTVPVVQVQPEQVGNAPVVQQAPEQPAAPAPAVKEEPKAADNEEQQPITPSEDTDFDFEIVSPMVGTFYAAPSPEDDPYVSVGSKVDEESIVCIVEAMKLFNEIEAEVSGEIVEILVNNGELVEYGQPLFRVKKK